MFTNKCAKYAQATTLVVLQIIAWNPIASLPQGAPESVCETMLPFHAGGIPPSQTPPLFRIETSTSSVGQGQKIRVFIKSVPPGLSFGGFMIQARNTNSPYEIVGQFNPSSDGSTKLMNCEDSVNNSATHSNAAPKPVISLEWQSPRDFLGQVVFNATVAQTYDSFWIGIMSNPVQVIRGNVSQPGFTTRVPLGPPSKVPYVPRPELPSTTPLPSDPFYTACGVSKTCFGFPDGCLKDKSCTFVSAVQVRGDIYEFEVKSGSNRAAYVALGLSEDEKMGNDLVIECVPQNGRVSMYSSYTSGAPNYGASRIGVTQSTARLLESSVIDGVIYCKVQRDVITNVKGRMFDIVKNKYHLLLASGSSLKENGVGYHDIGRIASGEPISLAVPLNLAGSSTLLLRLHGAFMVLAWIGTTSIGILLARYFKKTFVGSQTCGKDEWFAWHRICMVTTWSLTVAAFVIIFVELGAWSAERNPHAILGFITSILCFIQPIGALFRPDPNSRRRPIFNLAHWLIGNVAHILAIVTIFFSVKLTKSELPEWMDWILVSYVVVHVIVHLIFSVADCLSDRQQTQRVNTFNMGDISHHQQHGMRNGVKIERKLDAPNAAFRKGLLAVYAVVLVLFVVVLILIVVLAPIEKTFKSIQNSLN